VGSKIALAGREQKRIPGQSLLRKLWLGYTRGQNGFYIIVRRLIQGVLRLYSGLLRLAQALLRHAHPRLGYAHPQLRLKQQLLTSGD